MYTYSSRSHVLQMYDELINYLKRMLERVIFSFNASNYPKYQLISKLASLVVKRNVVSQRTNEEIEDGKTHGDK